MGRAVHDILGRRLRDRVRFASYLFFRYPIKEGTNEVRTIEQLVTHARELKQLCGFTSHKLKGGVFPPEYELDCYRALASELDGDRFRFDPNCVWSTETAIWFGQQIEDINNDYLEDPVFGLHGMRRTREKVRMPLATNTVVVNFEQLAANVLDTAVDVILLDTTFWGGIRQCVKSSWCLRDVSARGRGSFIGGAGYSACHHAAPWCGDTESLFRRRRTLSPSHRRCYRGGKLKYQDGSIAVPAGPGLGVRLDREKLAQYSELYQLGHTRTTRIHSDRVGRRQSKRPLGRSARCEAAQ